MRLLESFAISFYKVNCVFGQCINPSSQNNRRQFSKRFSQVLKFLKMVIKCFENQIYKIHLIKFWLSIILYSLPTVTVQFVIEEKALESSTAQQPSNRPG